MRRVHLFASLAALIALTGFYIFDAVRMKEIRKYNWLDFKIEIHFSTFETIVMITLVVMPFLFYILSLVWNYTSSTIFKSKILTIALWITGIVSVGSLGLMGYIAWESYSDNQKGDLIGRALAFLYPPAPNTNHYQLGSCISVSVALLLTILMVVLMWRMQQQKRRENLTAS
jgi:hypothetical protein